MPTCREIAERATDYTEGHLGLLAHLRVRLHVATCRHCRDHVRQLGVTAGALRRLPEPELSPELSDALLRRFDSWQASRETVAGRHPAGAPQAALPRSGRSRQGWQRAAWSAFATLAAFALLLLFASHRSPAVEDRAIASALAAAALVLAALSSRFSLGVVVAAVSAAFAAALARGGHGPLAFSTGLHCLGAEIAAGAVVAGATWLALRPGPSPRARHALAAAAAAGAVAADAALHVTCASVSLPHLLVFHVGGVVAAAAGAAMLSRVLVRARTA